MPRRRWEVTIRIGADSIEQVENALDEVARSLLEKPRSGAIDIVMGGPGFGFIVEGAEQPEVTHDAYFKALALYQASRREVER